MKDPVMEFQAQKNLLTKRVELGMVQSIPGGNAFAATGVSMLQATEGQVLVPFMHLTPEDAQRLMDALWGCGIRPTEQGSPGQLKATEAHLADMRAIAFQALQFDPSKK